MASEPLAPIISDHAVIRFLERAYGLGEFLAGVRAEIAQAATPAIDFGASVVVIHNTRLILREGTVVTVLPKVHRARDRARAHRARLNGGA